MLENARISARNELFDVLLETSRYPEQHVLLDTKLPYAFIPSFNCKVIKEGG
jgi:hypothetical protein